MFYSENQQEVLRFGDVVEGYISSVPIIDKPLVDLRNGAYSIQLDLSRYYAVMTPCCSIGEGTISLTPLIQVKYNFFKNPYFQQDLTNINRVMSPDKSVSSIVWNSLPEEQRQRRIQEGTTYDLLPKYRLGPTIGKIETNYYMIDFRAIFKLNCKEIKNPKESPLESKILELTIPVRNELRDKLADYYKRRPKEDLILVDSH